MSNHGMDSSLLTRLLEWFPVFAMIGALIRWIFQLKGDAEDAHRRLDRMDERLRDFENKIDAHLTEINRRIDDCKNAILNALSARC